MGIQDTCDFQTSIMGRATLKDGIPTFWGTKGRALQWLVTAVATTDFLLFGYDQGVMSGIISSEAFVTDFPEVHNDSTYEGFVVSIYAVGCFLGALFILNFGDWLGRRRSIYIGAVVMVIGVIIQLAAVPVGGGATGQFIVGRAITGVGNGINTSTVPTYQSECSKAHNRGRLICIEGGNVAIGTLIAYWIDYGCLYGPDPFTWRFPIAFQCVFAFIVIALNTRLPESPRWLLTKDRIEEATEVMAALEGRPVEDEEVKFGVQVIIDSIRASGRRKLYLIGTLGQMLSMIITFGALIPGTQEAGKGAAVGLFTYIAFFGATWLPLPWLYPAEINPLKTRAKANAPSTTQNWIWNFFIVMITPVLIENIGWGTYLFFAALNASFFPILYFFYPETSGRTLEEIDLIFAKGYVEKMSYVHAAQQLPKLDAKGIDDLAKEYGFSSDDDEAGQVKEARFGEKEDDLAENAGGQMV